ncbi:MAG: HEAT repeat domain-containing protein [Planctomycetes bacterium]|nr:HEAT repeat domain-containing protein [Planctomycetota bacterium]
MNPATHPKFLCILMIAAAAAQDSRPQFARSAADIIQSLESKDFATRRDAVWSCRETKDPRLIAALRETLKKDAHPDIRKFAAEVLGELGDAESAPLFYNIIKSDPFPGPRGAAYVALGRLRDAGAFDILMKGLASREDAYAARGLGYLGDARAFDPIFAIVKDKTPDPYDLKRIIQALFDLDATRATVRIVKLYESIDDDKRFAFALGLTDGAPPDAIRSLAERELEQPSLARQDAAFVLLRNVRDPGSAQKVVDYLKKGGTRRKAAFDAIGRCGDARCGPDLLIFLESERGSVERYFVVDAIGKLKIPGAARVICTKLATESRPVVSVQMCDALVRLGDRRAVATLLAKLDDDRRDAQPDDVEASFPFPWNVAVGDAAAWAAATLVDGGEPFSTKRLTRLDPEPDSKKVSALRKSMKERRAALLADPTNAFPKTDK